jgi:hypothetical protein
MRSRPVQPSAPLAEVAALLELGGDARQSLTTDEGRIV